MNDINYQSIWSKSNTTAAEWLLNIADRRRQYVQRQSEFSCLSVVTSDGQPSAHNPGRPTERMGMQLVDLEAAKCWIMTIELVESMLSPKKSAYLQLRREANGMPGTGERGRPAWVGYVQCALINRHGIDLSESAMLNWWHEIVELTVRVAIKRGCL